MRSPRSTGFFSQGTSHHGLSGWLERPDTWKVYLGLVPVDLMMSGVVPGALFLRSASDLCEWSHMSNMQAEEDTWLVGVVDTSGQTFSVSPTRSRMR